MECVIKMIKGPEEGQEHRLSSIESLLGRSPRAVVKCSDPQVSYEHAVVTRSGDEYFIENLSANGTFINDEKLSGKVKLRVKDEVRLGVETSFRVDSTGAEAGQSKRKLLLLAVSVMLILMIVVLVADPFGGTVQRNWIRSYNALAPWADAQTKSKHLPDRTSDLLHEAWRMDRAGDRSGASKMYFQLKVLLATDERTRHLDESAANYRGALNALQDPKTDPTTLENDVMGAALLQFVNGRMAQVEQPQEK